MDPEKYVGKYIDEKHIKAFLKTAELKPGDVVDISAIDMPWAFRGEVEYLGTRRQYVLEGFGNYMFLEGIGGMFARAWDSNITDVIEDILKD